LAAVKVANLNSSSCEWLGLRSFASNILIARECETRQRPLPASSRVLVILEYHIIKQWDRNRKQSIVQAWFDAFPIKNGSTIFVKWCLKPLHLGDY
jgi:hypothetical protein